MPHLGLVPPNRTPSGSVLPPQSAIPQPSASSAHASGSTSLPSLHALHNFLPFGSGKTASSTAIPGLSKNPFASFMPGRRSSLTFEHKTSSQFPCPGEENDTGVISISSPSQQNTGQTQGSKTGADGLEPSLPSLSASYEEVGPPAVSFNPEPPLSTELSTILESDLSGSSKHIPALDKSQISDVSGNGHSIKPEVLCPSPDINELVAPDASVLDLSTSQLKEEVMYALKEKPSTNGWLAGVVVENATDSRPTSRNDRKELEFDIGEEPEESLHLDALDSDLAALLGSNRLAGKQSLFWTENPFASTQIPQQPHPIIVPLRIFPPTRTVTPQSRPSPLASSPVDTSPSSTIGSTRSQPSLACTTTPHGYSSLPRSAPSRFMPQLMCSVTDRATPVREDRNVENVARAPSDPALPIDDARRVSIDSVYQRQSPASPLETQPPPLPPLPHAEPHRRVATSRLSTPAHFGAHAPASSRLLRAALPSSSALQGIWDKDSPSPSSCASLALGSATDRLVHPRTSEDGGHEGRLTARERLGYTPRNQNRSLSMGGGKNERVTSPSPWPTEWLGPRTAKAFAAAGLLDRFELADFLYCKEQMSGNKIDELMKILAALQSAPYNDDDVPSPPFSDARDLYDVINSTELGDVPWEGFAITYDGEVPDNPPNWMSTPYEVWFCDSLLVMESQIGNRDFGNEMDHAPKQVFSQTGTRQFCDLMSGDWAWGKQYNIFLGLHSETLTAAL
ncbi:hypothetical protein F5888DRAFT_1869464 [Russula emetica]|nr:hypothetical protein F5888DRAFT_1869464 [Russula emetica]